MKILIIAIPRSGSQSLMKCIGSCLKLTTIGEPFNEAIRKNVNFNDTVVENNVVVKSLIDINIPNVINFYKEYSKSFDKTILLSRKNTKELSESYEFQIWKDELTTWHQKYTYSQNGDIDKWVEFMIKTKNNLEILSNELNIEIDWYEDLYCGDEEKIVNFLNKHEITVDIPEFSEYLNPKHKLRQGKKTII
jgi:hypothetical protein